MLTEAERTELDYIRRNAAKMTTNGVIAAVESIVTRHERRAWDDGHGMCGEECFERCRNPYAPVPRESKG